MVFQKIKNFLDTTSDNKDSPTFVTKKYIKFMINQKEITMLRSHLCDFSDAYIAVKGNITVTKETFTVNDFEAPNNTAANVTATNTTNNNELGDKKIVFKNNALFINCISKINGVKNDNAEDLDVVMPM